MTTLQPDIFVNVHKGIRSALFHACMALGRASDADAVEAAAARELLRQALHFVAHHGDNEDTLLLPLLVEPARAVFDRIESAHATVNAALEDLRSRVDSAPLSELYQRASSFLALYVEHMREEERDLEPSIRGSISTEELAAFGRRAMERTSPADRRMMLGWMLPAMTAEDVEALLANVPDPAKQELRQLARRPA